MDKGLQGQDSRSLLHLQHDLGAHIVQQEKQCPLQPSCDTANQSPGVRDGGDSRRSRGMGSGHPHLSVLANLENLQPGMGFILPSHFKDQASQGIL